MTCRALHVYHDMHCHHKTMFFQEDQTKMWPILYKKNIPPLNMTRPFPTVLSLYKPNFLLELTSRPRRWSTGSPESMYMNMFATLI